MLFWYFLTRCEFHSWPTGCLPLHSLSSYFHFVQNFKWALNCMKQDLIVGCIPHSCRKFLAWPSSQPGGRAGRGSILPVMQLALELALELDWYPQTGQPMHCPVTNIQIDKCKNTNTQIHLSWPWSWTGQTNSLTTLPSFRHTDTSDWQCHSAHRAHMIAQVAHQ